MKSSSWRVAAVSFSLLLICVITTPIGAQKKKEKNSDEVEVSAKYESEGSRNSCSCRGLQNQIDTLEARLDRMIDLWNDFVDRNQDQQYPGGLGGNRRQPPQGGRGQGPYPYPERERPGSGRFPPRRMGSERGYGYDMRNDDYDQVPRRFRP